jgi:hypothetical protein
MEEIPELREVLSRKADVVAARWCDAVLATYPERAYAAWTREKDPFANPVGHSLRVGTRAILDALLEGAGGEALRESVRDIVRIRAVQQMPPSVAVGFVFQLKDAVRSVLADELRDRRLAGELARLDRDIDGAAMAAFDVYAEERDRVVELRINELKRNIPWFVGRTGQAAVERELG